MDKPEAIKGFNLGQIVTSVICPLRFYSEANTAIPHTPTTQNIISNSFCVAFSIRFYCHQRLHFKTCLKSTFPTILTSTKDGQLSIKSCNTQGLPTINTNRWKAMKEFNWFQREILRWKESSWGISCWKTSFISMGLELECPERERRRQLWRVKRRKIWSSALWETRKGVRHH